MCDQEAAGIVEEARPGRGREVIIVSAHARLDYHDLIPGFLRAVERFRFEANPTTNSESVHAAARGHAALFESLSWAYAIFEAFDAANLHIQDQELRDAFKRARALAQHQAWGAIDTIITLAPEGLPNVWTWGTPKRSRRSGNSQESAFSNRLAGRNVLETLDELALQFWPLRSWQVTEVQLWQPGQYGLPPHIELDASPRPHGQASE